MQLPIRLSRAILATVVGLASALVCSTASAASPMGGSAYPTKPVKIVVPFPPGGTNDIVGRLVAKYLETELGQPFVVENLGGAGGIIGTEFVARAAPDGYTLLAVSSGPMATSLSLYKDRIKYDVKKDFVPIATLIDVTVVVAASPKFPAHDIAGLIEYAKKNPGAVRAGLPAVGSMHHLLTAQFEIDAGVNLNLIPYKGSGPTVLDLMGNHIDIDFDNMPAVIEQIRAHKLQAFAVSTPERNTALPDVPSFKELGMSNLLAAPWFVLVAPEGTPQEIVTVLNKKIQTMMSDPETKKKLASIGANPAWRSQKETQEFLDTEVSRWAATVEKTGLKIE
ncbi:Bug family tripartite tricarboxylate transporter substrate binding protein [Allopusillimonas soli]|uniref:Tripartite tricarboxylate transporter substrate binding protein n=1 Tax=Allopusillimonas soli TaxID=659016 RepID=A0A853F7Y3_9BURK|nr:tripartite tricarboxylate transporter substrate binding protein [Allopusillimonas soli]NYT36097.1 tripartite tricarboxylate transporter substrate binding protein [Allopusillimonas soli]